MRPDIDDKASAQMMERPRESLPIMYDFRAFRVGEAWNIS
jgi:hypothetical protein